MNKNTKTTNIVIFRDKSRDITLRADQSQETIWATQAQIAQLFNSERSVITKHLRNIFKDHELNEVSVCAKFAHTAADGKTYNTQYYNLDAIIAVGYRVNSKQATNFRIWATKTLRDFILKGYVVNEKRLKSIQRAKLSELDKTIRLITGVREKIRNQDEAKALLSVINDYTQTWILLNQYDKRDVGKSTGKKSAVGCDRY